MKNIPFPVKFVLLVFKFYALLLLIPYLSKAAPPYESMVSQNFNVKYHPQFQMGSSHPPPSDTAIEFIVHSSSGRENKNNIASSKSTSPLPSVYSQVLSPNSNQNTPPAEKTNDTKSFSSLDNNENEKLSIIVDAKKSIESDGYSDTLKTNIASPETPTILNNLLPTNSGKTIKENRNLELSKFNWFKYFESIPSYYRTAASAYLKNTEVPTLKQIHLTSSYLYEKTISNAHSTV